MLKMDALTWMDASRAGSITRPRTWLNDVDAPVHRTVIMPPERERASYELVERGVNCGRRPLKSFRSLTRPKIVLLIYIYIQIRKNIYKHAVLFTIVQYCRRGNSNTTCYQYWFTILKFTCQKSNHRFGLQSSHLDPQESRFTCVPWSCLSVR